VIGHSSKPKCFPLGYVVVAVALVMSACKTPEDRSSQLESVAQSQAVRVHLEPQFFPVDSPTDSWIYQNRVITRNYYFGSNLLNQALFGTGSAFEANWLHFGIWGSLRAGESIDGSDLEVVYLIKDIAFDTAESLLQWLPAGIRTESIEGLRSERSFASSLKKIIERSLAAGNRRVADEIMGLADRYIRQLGCDKTYDEVRVNDFLKTFFYQLDQSAGFEQIWSALLWDIPALSAGKRHNVEGGQDALALAFKAYHQAKFERDPALRSQMMHYGNLLIAIHEQFVLQTYISSALGLLDPASPLYRKVATMIAMDIGIPAAGFDGVSANRTGLKRVKLRNGFPKANFSPTMMAYSWPPLVEVARITGVDVNAGRGATDWTDYKTRVYLIAGMLRTYQQSPMIALFPYVGTHDEPRLSCY
jgi:hypothetical protein